MQTGPDAADVADSSGEPLGNADAESAPNGSIPAAYPFEGENNEQPQVNYLPLCIKYGTSVKLFHAKIRLLDETIEDDETVFKRIKAEYQHQKGPLKRSLSCWRLRGINKIKVCICIVRSG